MGLIYAPKSESWWSKDYALLPTAELINEDCIRVYYASLDKNNYGRIGYVDLAADNPQHILNLNKEPILDLGEFGTFDDCGVNPSCVLNIAEKKYLYYIGWQKCEKVPYMLFTGLAIKDENSSVFKKISRVPILDRTDIEPFSRSAPYILNEGKVMKMWYWSCIKWNDEVGQVHYNNVIKYATSVDGICWNSEDHICVAPDFIQEYSIGRPWVIHEANIYKMWYSIRSKNELYKIGYAESGDGLHWIRKDDEVGISKSKTGWDSEMICYPCVIDAKKKRYMFYNGNQHGATGFGYAVLEQV
jgi:hypothetical protein